MEECSKLCRWFEGMDQSVSRGCPLAGPMKSSMAMEIKLPIIIRVGSI